MSQLAEDTTILSVFLERTSKSRALHTNAQQFLPGGNSRTVVYYNPYPIYLTRGKGCRIYDVDGNEYIDYLNNYTSLILGHGHPKIIAAVQEQLEQGTCYAAPTEFEAQHAEILQKRVPSMELLRYANSGSEATLNAIRAARAFTGKPKLAKMEGGYHGSHDAVEISVSPPPRLAGSKKHPKPVPDAAGIPESVVKDVLIMPYNDSETADQLIHEHAKELAAVIVEPVFGAGGLIPAKKEFLQTLREVTEENDVLLIFDEVISFRISRGGAQEYFNVQPDLTALGKIIGGGFAVGAFGGREEIMTLFSPSRGPPILPHSGTFNGNPITLIAGLTVLNELTPQVYDRLNSAGEWIRTRLNEVFEEVGMKGQATGIGSLFNIHFTDQEIANYRDAASADRELFPYFHLDLLNQGIFMAPRGMGCLSVPMTETELEKFANSVKKSLMEISGRIAPYKPELFK